MEKTAVMIPEDNVALQCSAYRSVLDNSREKSKNTEVGL